VLLLLREVREVGDEVGRPGEKRAKKMVYQVNFKIFTLKY
jgi:hypothetical protein